MTRSASTIPMRWLSAFVLSPRMSTSPPPKKPAVCFQPASTSRRAGGHSADRGLQTLRFSIALLPAAPRAREASISAHRSDKLQCLTVWLDACGGGFKMDKAEAAQPPRVPIVPEGDLRLVPDKSSTAGEREAVGGYVLEFDATQTEPPLDKMFLKLGGAIGAAQSRGRTDFAVSGSEFSTVHKLSDEFCTRVRVPLPEGRVRASPTAPNKITLDARSKLLLCSSRGGVAINGTLVDSISGQGAVYLHGLLSSASIGNAPIPLTHSSWKAHSAVVTISGARVVDALGRQQNIEFQKHEEREAALEASEKYLSSYGDGAWNMRQTQLVYPYSPTLTKAIAKVPTGLNDSGFDLAHNVLMQKTPYSLATIDALFKNAVHMELDFLDEDINKFEEATARPGKVAMAWGRTVAGALSSVANTLVAYRADGRTALTPQGAQAQAAESWLRMPPRSPTEANDCDGSAICVLSLVRAAVDASDAEREAHPYLRAVRNTVWPHHQLGLAVVGASAAAASQDLGGDRQHALAGHATVVMLPTLSVLRALEKGAARTRANSESGRLQAVAAAQRADQARPGASCGLLRRRRARAAARERARRGGQLGGRQGRARRRALLRVRRNHARRTASVRDRRGVCGESARGRRGGQEGVSDRGRVHRALDQGALCGWRQRRLAAPLLPRLCGGHLPPRHTALDGRGGAQYGIRCVAARADRRLGADGYWPLQGGCDAARAG